MHLLIKNPENVNLPGVGKIVLKKVFWLTYENITAQVVSAEIRPAIIKSTDPLAVSLKIKSCRKRGPGYWKLNNT